VVRQRRYARYPHFGALPRSLYDVTDELRVDAGIERIRWQGESLRLDGFAWIPGLEMDDRSEVRVWVEHGLDGSLELPVSRVDREDLVALHGPGRRSSGFSAVIDTGRLRTERGWRYGTWAVRTEVTSGGAKLAGTPSSWAQVRGVASARRRLSERVYVQAVNVDGGTGMRLLREGSMVEGCGFWSGAFEIAGSVPGVQEHGHLVVSRHRRTAGFRIPVEFFPAGDRSRFRVRVPLDAFPGGTSPIPVIDEEVGWVVRLEYDGRDTPLQIGDGFAEIRRADGAREVVFTCSDHGNLTAVSRTARLVVEEARWDGDVLTLAGVHNTARPGTLVLGRRGLAELREIPIDWSGDRFTVRIDLADLPDEGQVDCYADGSPVVVDRSLAWTLPDPRAAAGKEVRPRLHLGDRLRLGINPFHTAFN
jgi:CDP-glycerol glycerophosphotransferase